MTTGKNIALTTRTFVDKTMLLLLNMLSKKRWQEYTEELYKKDLHDPDNHNGVITHQSQTYWNVKSNGP